MVSLTSRSTPDSALVSSIERLIARFREHHATEGTEVIRRAGMVAISAHEGQLRRTGEPYVTHPIAVAGIVTATTTQWNAVTGGGSGLTPGAKYYLSGTTAGGLTTTVPSTNYLIFMGTALSTTQLELADCVPVRLT